MVCRARELQPALREFLSCLARLHAALGTTAACLAAALQALQQVTAVADRRPGPRQEQLHHAQAGHQALLAGLLGLHSCLARHLLTDLAADNDQFKKSVNRSRHDPVQKRFCNSILFV